MKEADIFESWANQLVEGTWALPDNPEAQEKLNTLMSSELIVGPDATNATELLYNVIGDDQLFDILADLAERSNGRANIWDDSDVQARLAELGIQMPGEEAVPTDAAGTPPPTEVVPPPTDQQMMETDNLATFVEEGSCNQTMEGEYCPEHGLEECWSSGSMSPVMGEGNQQAFVNKHHDDPINSNSAMTGSYYESDELARIKSLALLK